MDTSPQLVQRLNRMVGRRNRELALDAGLKASLGALFTLVTYAVVFWLCWFFGLFVAGNLNLAAWEFSAILTGLLLVVALWTAWRRVDPLAGLAPPTDRQLLLKLVSFAATGMYFSPRHASAGAALILIGGPANIFEAIGIWAHRLRTDSLLLEAAARLLDSCRKEMPAEQVREPRAALLLLQLALIKVIPRHDSVALTLTDKGSKALPGGKAGKRTKERPKNVRSETSEEDRETLGL